MRCRRAGRVQLPVAARCGVGRHRRGHRQHLHAGRCRRRHADHAWRRATPTAMARPRAVTSAATAAVANVNDAPTGLLTISGTRDRRPDPDRATQLHRRCRRAGRVQLPVAARRRRRSAGRPPAPTRWATPMSARRSACEVKLHRRPWHGREPLTSAATAAVANVNDAPTGVVTISGTPTEDQMLTREHRWHQRCRRARRDQLPVAARRRRRSAGRPAAPTRWAMPMSARRSA